MLPDKWHFTGSRQSLVFSYLSFQAVRLKICLRPLDQFFGKSAMGRQMFTSHATFRNNYLFFFLRHSFPQDLFTQFLLRKLNIFHHLPYVRCYDRWSGGSFQARSGLNWGHMCNERRFLQKIGVDYAVKTSPSHHAISVSNWALKSGIFLRHPVK